MSIFCTITYHIASADLLFFGLLGVSLFFFWWGYSLKGGLNGAEGKGGEFL